MKKKKIKIPIYFVPLTIIRAKKISKANKKYNIDFSKFAAVVWKKEESKYLELFICFTVKPTQAIIAHEIIHIVNHIFIARGIELCRYNDEAQAYLTGYLVEKINKALKKLI